MRNLLRSVGYGNVALFCVGLLLMVGPRIIKGAA